MMPCPHTWWWRGPWLPSFESSTALTIAHSGFQGRSKNKVVKLLSWDFVCNNAIHVIRLIQDNCSPFVLQQNFRIIPLAHSLILQIRDLLQLLTSTRSCQLFPSQAQQQLAPLGALPWLHISGAELDFHFLRHIGQAS